MLFSIVTFILFLVFASTHLIPHKVSAAHSPARHLDSQSRTASVRGRLASLRRSWCRHWHCGNTDLSTFFVWFVVRVAFCYLFLVFYTTICNLLLFSLVPFMILAFICLARIVVIILLNHNKVLLLIYLVSA